MDLLLKYNKLQGMKFSCYFLMVHSHCTGPEQGEGPGQGDGPGQGEGPGNDGFLCYAMYCTYYTMTGQGHWTIAFYCGHPHHPCCVYEPQMHCRTVWGNLISGLTFSLIYFHFAGFFLISCCICDTNELITWRSIKYVERNSLLILHVRKGKRVVSVSNYFS